MNILDEIDKKELGRRLTTARRQKRLSQDDVAKIFGIARTTVIAIEKGERRVKAEELLAFAELYEREIGDFVRKLPAIEPAIAQFRGPAYKSEKDLEDVQPYIEMLEELSRNYWELEELLGKSYKDKYPAELQHVQSKSSAEAEAAAISERNRLGLGDAPLPILRDLLEQEVGLRIFYIPMGAADGFSEIYFYNETLGACIAINSDHPEERRRWSLSHAYGHFLAHRRAPSAEQNKGKIPESEIFADQFGPYFLMPTSSLIRKYAEVVKGSDAPTLADLFRLAHFYGVSVPALSMRLEDMGYLERGATNRLKRHTVKVADAMKELGLSAIPSNSERLPHRYRLLALEAFSQGLLSEGQLAYFLQLDLVRVRRIAEVVKQIDISSSSKIEEGLERE